MHLTISTGKIEPRWLYSNVLGGIKKTFYQDLPHFISAICDDRLDTFSFSIHFHRLFKGGNKGRRGGSLDLFGRIGLVEAPQKEFQSPQIFLFIIGIESG